MSADGGTKLLRNIVIAAFIVAVAIILVGGYYARDKVPPIPQRVEGPGGTLSDRDAIMRGQDVYQSHGLMDHGSLWGHGTLRGMDFSADTLHLMGQWARDFHAGGQAVAYENLPPDRKAAVDQRVIGEIKHSRVDNGVLTLTPALAYAFEQNRRHWGDKFRDGDTGVGFLPNTVAQPQQRQDISDFFFWAAWAAGALRPGEAATYTVNWPYDPTVGNVAAPEAFLWSVLSILALLAVLGVIVYIVHRYGFFFGEAKAADISQSLLETPVTPSQRATAKFFLVAVLLFLVQILNGGLLANYTVRPGQFYIQTIGKLYPYSWAKTWHVQLAILWIALAWVGTAIYIGPFITHSEPRRQRLLVNLLFWAVVGVVVASLTGEVLSIKGLMGDWWFWLGHQGWEYLELGRLWQILLLGGLVFWLVIVYRTMIPALRNPGGAEIGSTVASDRRSLIVFYIISAVLIVVFFAFGLFYGRGTHLTIAEYWRWFVVHIWVEGIFEFFGVAVISLFLVFMGLVQARAALRVAYLTATLVLFYGIPGVAHHYFWVGGPSYWLALGGVFSSLEPVPLILLVVRAWMEYRAIRRQGREFPYKWPLYFLVASSIWNFVGAAIFGFIMNLPIINYYTHATYLTANHAHTALFGVYGMLAISLLLFSWRGLIDEKHWSDRLLKVSFWGLNGGLFLMFSTSLLPIALMQINEVATNGFHAARSAAFWQLPHVRGLAEWRIVPDMVIIIFGALPLLWFLIKTFPKLRTK
ncbi:MAG: cbb3-type cytochrome c oxidase subunit I [Planctomycetaceae bacterium]|nr:cbb3-type cytochrome c oxidase subunit I [Planctomycetaceae bacterium]